MISGWVLSASGPTVDTMTRLAFADYLAHLRADSARFRAVLTGADPASRVPACPDWDAQDLLWHLTEVQWFWGTRMRERPAPPTDDDVRPERPGTREDLLALFDRCSAELADQLAAADPAEPAWSWADEQTVGFTFRRQAHEALIHRLDAEQTVAEVTPLDPALAADGVAELLDVMYGGQPREGETFESSGLVRLDLTDRDLSLWAAAGVLRGGEHEGPHLMRVEDPGTEPDAVLSGTAADLDIWLWRRSDGATVQRTGSQTALDAFLAAVDFPLD